MFLSNKRDTLLSQFAQQITISFHAIFLFFYVCILFRTDYFPSPEKRGTLCIFFTLFFNNVRTIYIEKLGQAMEMLFSHVKDFLYFHAQTAILAKYSRTSFYNTLWLMALCMIYAFTFWVYRLWFYGVCTSFQNFPAF